jgi:hypothetical protein
MNCDDLLSPSHFHNTLIPHLAEAKCSLSPVAVVCVHSVERVAGVGRIDNSPIGAG